MRQLLTGFVVPLLLTLSACGGRTGLFWDDGGASDDGGPSPDVFPTFPCAFFPTGYPLSVREGQPGNSLNPQLAAGEGRLGLTYAIPGDIPLFGTRLFCDTHRDEGYHCPRELELVGGYILPSPIAWNGESFGICWTGIDFFVRGRSVPLFATVSASGELLRDPLDFLAYADGNCNDLVWSGERYVATIRRLPSGPTEYMVVALDRNGRPIGSPLLEMPRSTHWYHVGALAADQGMEVIVRAEESEIVLRRLDAPRLIETVTPGGGTVGLPVIALSRPVVGLFWHETTGLLSTSYIQLVDMERAIASEPLELPSTSAEIHSTAVVSVAEGFVVAWSEVDDDESRIEIVSISVAGLEMHAWEPIRIFEGRRDDLRITGATGRLTMAYDGRSVFVAYSSYYWPMGRYVVQLQQLDCIR